jgi:protein PhnA
LCETSGTPLSVYEVPPVADVPEYEHCVLLCGACRERIDRFPGDDVQARRVLEKSAWSDVPAVQVLSIRMLLRLAERHSWASLLLDTLVVEPEVLSRAELQS